MGGRQRVAAENHAAELRSVPPYATTAGTKTETTGITTAAVKPKVSEAPTERKTVDTTKIMKEPMH